jgi:hypothetical protein
LIIHNIFTISIETVIQLFSTTKIVIMKKNLLILILCTLSICIHAKTRTEKEASQLASQFLSSASGSLQKAPTSSNSKMQLAYSSKKTNDSNALYYIYNKGNKNGYVIISGDDRAKTVLGYADDGDFDFSILPESAKEWLRFYESEITSLPEVEIPTIKAVRSTVANEKSEFPASINPLLENIKWNQASPYNNLCPIIDSTKNVRAMTGCVATAMAQVMRYYKWPVKGTGSHSYKTSSYNLPLSLDFYNTTFDWNNISETYDSNSSSNQNNAVATLMYNCGVAINTDYAQSSSASSIDVAIALSTYFGYDKNIQIYSRDYCSKTKWVEMLKTELSAARPILYGGINSSSVGHMFVCDGYDENGLFHFNWGWGGYANGYFEISALDPTNLKTSSNTGGFNNIQTIITGIQKPNSFSVPTYMILMPHKLTTSNDSISRTDSFSIVSQGIGNYGANKFTGKVGVALYNSNGFIDVLKYESQNDLIPWSGWGRLPFLVKIPDKLSNGNYQIHAVYKSSTDSSWQIIKGKIGTPEYLNVLVSSSTILIKTPQNASPALNLDSLATIGNLYQNKTARFNVNITNYGTEYNSLLKVYLQSNANNKISQIISVETINITSNETRNLIFSANIKVDPGQYKLCILYDSTNNESTVQYATLGSELMVNVLAETNDSAKLVLNSKISFPNSSSVDKNNVTLTAQIKNTGGAFNNVLVANIFPLTSENSLSVIGYQSIVLDSNEEKTVTFKAPVDLAPGNYRIAVYCFNAGSGWNKITPNELSTIPFTLVDKTTEVNNTNTIGLEVFPNPASDILKLKSDLFIKQITISDLQGKQLKSLPTNHNNEIATPIEDLKSGIYLIKVQTDNTTKIVKFMKR